ncbi:MAG TPA: hypothetical protein VF182_09645 [Candidatus Binatia bacterium]
MIAILSPYLCVVALQLLLLYPLHTTLDLPTWDEAIYLQQGGWFLHGEGLGPISISPVYSLLYSVLIKIFGTVDSVFTMQYLVKVTVSGLLLLCLVEHLRSRLLALLLTLIWVVSGINIFERVLVYHVALGFFLLALFSLNKHRGISLLLLVLCSLTRLEYLFPTLAFAGYLIFISVPKFKRRGSQSTSVKRRVTAPIFMGFLLAAAILYVIVNVDGLNPGTDRTWLAFNQNYALHEVEAGRYKLNPYLDYNFIIQEDFPGAESLADAFTISPGLFLKHVARNIAMLPQAVLSFIIPYIGLRIWLNLWRVAGICDDNRDVRCGCQPTIHSVRLARRHRGAKRAALRNRCELAIASSNTSGLPAAASHIDHGSALPTVGWAHLLSGVKYHQLSAV